MEMHDAQRMLGLDHHRGLVGGSLVHVGLDVAL